MVTRTGIRTSTSTRTRTRTRTKQEQEQEQDQEQGRDGSGGKPAVSERMIAGGVLPEEWNADAKRTAWTRQKLEVLGGHGETEQ